MFLINVRYDIDMKISCPEVEIIGRGVNNFENLKKFVLLIIEFFQKLSAKTPKFPEIGGINPRGRSI
jgi:hypothetical protein